MTEWKYFDAKGNRMPDEKRATFKAKEITVAKGEPSPPGMAAMSFFEYRDVHHVDRPELRKSFESFRKMKDWFAAQEAGGKARLATPPPHPTDVPDKQQVAFTIEHNGTRIIAFVSYVLLQQITVDLGSPLDMFRVSQEQLVAAAAAKFDAGKVDDEGFVRLGPGDIPSLTWPRD
jgi:hypothetical protein